MTRPPRDRSIVDRGVAAVASGKVPATVKDPAAWVDLKELDEHGEDLTQWEIDFVEHLTVALLEGRQLSRKQHAKLQTIREDRLP